MWISPEFKIYLIKEFQRLKAVENDHYNSNGIYNAPYPRYHKFMDAIKENLIPKNFKKKPNYLVLRHADLLNVAFVWYYCKRMARNQPRCRRKTLEITIEQLVVLSNMESINLF
jgi:hypothetical protein